jgi:hypothetical protein
MVLLELKEIQEKLALGESKVLQDKKVQTENK